MAMQPLRTPISRRNLLTAGTVAAAGLLGACAAAPAPRGSAAGSPAAEPRATEVPARTTILPFYGDHQSGIETPPATWQTFVGMNLRHSDRPARAREVLEASLRLITDDAARLTQGQPALGDTEPALATTPSALTITVGLGPAVFDETGISRPDELVDLPAFDTDALRDEWGQTDLLLQVGSDDPMTVAHALRMLTKDLAALTTVRWTQPGFRSWEAQPGSSTGRNLMGQVDGTVNPLPGSPDFGEVAWLTGPGTWAGGSILVLRRIRLLLDTWDSLDVAAKESVIGRRLDNGAPLGRTDEFDPVPFGERGPDGLPLIPTDSHIAVAHAGSLRESIYRRPYNYDAGVVDGTNDMGLLFAAYMRDPRESFIPMQKRIASSDAFNRWNTTIGSAIYALPPGTREGSFLGEALFT